MTRNTFLYHPAAVADSAQTFILDWNVASRLVSMMEGQKFPKAPELVERLLDLSRRFPSTGRAIAGFAASEPGGRPIPVEPAPEVVQRRAFLAQEALESCARQFPAFFQGEVAQLAVGEAPSTYKSLWKDVLGMTEQFVTPFYTVLLKARLIDMKLPSEDRGRKIDEFKFWLRRELDFRPSRPVWIGMLMIAGTYKGREIASSVLKADKARTAEEIRKDLWGAAWDLTYSQFIAFSKDQTFLRGFPRPFVFVTDDAKLYDALVETDTPAVLKNNVGDSFGLDVMSTGDLIEPDLQEAVEGAIGQMNADVAKSSSLAKKPTKGIVRRARHQADLLWKELVKEMKSRNEPR